MSTNETTGRSTTETSSPSIRIHDWPLKTGITRTPEFEKKRLATHAVNVGTKCGHNCCYCSSGAVLRTHPSFRAFGESPSARDYAIVDPQTPARVARDAARIRKRGLVQLCTLTDAWAPEAHAHQLGRRCLEAILSQRLLPRLDGTGRVSIFEVLVATNAIRNLIREGKTHQMCTVMQTGAALGMITIDQALQDAIQAGLIRAGDASLHARDPERFLAL